LADTSTNGGSAGPATPGDPLARLAAGVAHEIDTPVRCVSDNLRFLSDAFTDVTALLDRSREICDAAQRGPISPNLMADVEEALRAIDVEQLRDEIPRALSRAIEGLGSLAGVLRRVSDLVRPEGETTLVDPGAAVEAAVTLARVEFIKVADFEMTLAPDLPPVETLGNDLQNAIYQLLERAAHAIADVAERRGTRGHIRVAVDVANGRLRVMIEDDGLGIPPERCQTMFQHRSGDGTKNGLALVDDVVRGRLGGRILFESGIGHGTRFHLLLPCQSDVLVGADS